MKERIIQLLSLFTSSGTLICCALPALVAAIAGGAAVSSMISVFPWLVPLSKHKLWIFIAAGVFIALSGWLAFRPQPGATCDAGKAESGCDISLGFQKRMFLISASIYLFGVFFTYLLVPILRVLDGLGGTA